MALVKCKECGTEISPKAKSCPQCGHDNRSWWGRRNIISKVFISFWVFIFGLSVLGAMFSGGETSTTTTTRTTIATTEAPKVEVLDISFFKFNALFGTEGTLTDVQKKARFDDEYKGKYVRWKCQLVDLSESLRMQMKCDPSTFAADMYVKLRRDQEDKAMSLTKDSFVTFEAKLTGYGEFMGHNADDGVIVG